MSLKNVATPEKNVAELEFDIDKASFEAEVNKVYRKSVAKMNIPGFRKGKAPRSIIEKMYGKGVFYEDALNALIPEAYEAALAESGIDAVSRPEFDVLSIEEEVVIKAKVYTKPIMTIADYKGIEAERPIEPVSEEEVDAQIKRDRDRNARSIEVTDRPAQEGDTANIDYEGSVDGVPFDGGKDNGHNLKLGSGSFIPGFEDQVIGHNVGDEFDVNVTFPEDYHEKSLAGKAAVFKCKLNSITYEELPELDDEFAKDASKFDTFEEYKNDIRATIEKRHQDTANNILEENLIDILLTKLEGDIPECMYDNEVENTIRDYDNRLRMQGLDLSTYLKYTGMDLDGMRSEFRPRAERQVRTRLALETIAALEGIEIDDEAVEAEYAKMAEAYGMETDKIKESLPADAIIPDLKVRRALELVREAAVVTDTEVKKPEPASDTAEIVDAAEKSVEAAEENKDAE